MIGDPTGPLQAWALPLVLLSAAWATDARAQVVLAPLHYDLNVEVDHEGELLRGTARIVVENPSAQRVDVASLLLYRLLRVRSVHGDAGDGLSFDQDVVAFEDFPKLQVNHLLVTLAEPLAPGQRTALDIEYEGHLLGYAETGMRYIQDRIDPAFTILRDDAYAYPQPGYPSSAVNRGVPMPSFTYAAAGCAATPDPDMLSAQVPVDVAVEFDPRDSLQAAAIETMAATAVGDIESFFERPFRESIIVNVLPDRAAFDEYFRSAWGIPATECWMVGAASPRGLVLLSPRVWLDQACEHDPRDRDHVGGIVAHELVHVLHGQYNPTEDFEGMDPLGWFVEGVAVLASGQLDARRGDAMEAMRAGALPTQLASVWSGRFRYGLAGSLVEYVDRTYGRAMVRRLLAATTQRQALDMLGVTEQQLLESWKSSLSSS